METTQKWFEQIAKPEPPKTNTIWSCGFHPDGGLLFVVISGVLVVYNADTGEVATQPAKAGTLSLVKIKLQIYSASDTVNAIAFSKDGKTFATGSNDKSCLIWKYNPDAQKKIEPVLKFIQSDAILCLSFNPLTHELFSGGAVDFALYTPGRQDIPKQKYKQKIICACWSPDGQTLAFGTMNGTISLRERTLDEKVQIRKTAPIWCMDWTPITPDHQESYLLVGCWDRYFYYFNSIGETRAKIADKRIPCNPLSINFHPSGQFFLMAGANRKISLWTRDLGFLTDIVQTKDWSWCSKFRPKSMQIAVTTNDGTIGVHQLSKKPIFSNYEEIFATRDNLTDVIIENLLINQKLRIKCKQLVKKISLFKDKLAVLQNDRLLIYVASEETLKYNPYRKITKKFDCEFMEILGAHVIFAHGPKLQLFNMIGELDKQWILESDITYMKALGGPPKREHVIIGLKSGQVLKIFVDNSFPINLYKSSVSIRKCDLNLSKKKLALVDANSNMLVIDLVTQTQIYQEMGIQSCCWNTDLEDTLAYSGNGTLSIRTANMPPLVQRTQAIIHGFKGFQLFVIKEGAVTAMDVSQSSTLVKFVEKKDYKMAYKLACLGVTDNDIRLLGIEALQNGDFEIAEKCFVKLKDLPFIELTRKYAELNKSGQLNDAFLKAEVLAYQGKYQEAASLYMKAGSQDQVINLYIELKRFEDALRYARISGSKEIQSEIMRKQAEWAIQSGDWVTAGHLYTGAKQYKKAIELYGKENYIEGLIEVCRMIDKADNQQNLQTCANLFKKNKHHAYAKEALLKLGDIKGLMNLHVEFERWDDAFMLGKQNRELLEIVKLPYAHYLLKNDRYEEALKAFKSQGKSDLTNKMLTTLGNNAVSEKRFLDAGRHYWTMAAEQLKQINDIKKLQKEEVPVYKKYQELKTISEIYYVYNSINTFVESPFFTSSQSALYTILNACRFLIANMGKFKLPYINLSYIYYSLAKVSKLLEGYKTARACYEKLAQLKVPNKWSEEIDLGSMLVKSKPYSDKDSILPICNRCLMANPVISEKNSCFNCKHPFVMSFVSFEVLPLVEFKVEAGISHSKVIQLLSSEKAQNKKAKKGGKKDDGWSESRTDKQQVLSLKHGKGLQQFESTPFYEKMSEVVEQQQAHVEYLPVTVGADVLATMELESVYFMDLRKINSSWEIRYFRNLVPDLLLKCCGECGKFFLLDEYEFEYVQHKKCPFCNMQDKRAGQTKDIFDV